MLCTRLLAALRLWLPPSQVANVFEPLVADWRHARNQAAGHARWLADARWIAAIATSITLSVPQVLLRTPSPVGTTRLALRRFAQWVSVISALLLLPFLTELRTVAPMRLAELLTLLLPAVLALAVPFAMFSVVDVIRRDPTPTLAERVTVVRFAAAGVLLSALLGGWLVPVSNQLFRQSVRGETSPSIARGIRELSTYELAVHPSRIYPAEHFTEAGNVRRELHTRGVMAVLPALLVWMHWVFLTTRRGASSVPASGATIAVMATFMAFYFLSINAEHAFGLRPGSGAWLPIGALILISVGRVVLSRQADLATGRQDERRV